MVNPLEATFPNLAKGGFQVTSPPTKDYNCIAWAVGDAEHWWWPIPSALYEGFWPTSASREETLTAFQAVFASLGYVVCDGVDLEAGFEKLALFANPEGVPLHAARQLPSGRWTSKLGELEDIEHALRDLEGPEYGSVVLVMKRLAQE